MIYNVFTKMDNTTDKQKHLSWICCHVSNGQTKRGKKKKKIKKRFKKTTTKKGCVMLTITLAATIFTHGKTKRLLLKVR